MQLIWELIFPPKDEKLSPESTYSVLAPRSIQNGPISHNLQCCLLDFNLSYTLASVLSFWEQTFFTGIGKTIELVFLFSVAVPHSNCNDHGFESVFDESNLRLKEKCICAFLAGPCYE